MKLKFVSVNVGPFPMNKRAKTLKSLMIIQVNHNVKIGKRKMIYQICFTSYLSAFPVLTKC